MLARIFHSIRTKCKWSRFEWTSSIICRIKTSWFMNNITVAWHNNGRHCKRYNITEYTTDGKNVCNKKIMNTQRKCVMYFLCRRFIWYYLAKKLNEQAIFKYRYDIAIDSVVLSVDFGFVCCQKRFCQWRKTICNRTARATQETQKKNVWCKKVAVTVVLLQKVKWNSCENNNAEIGTTDDEERWRRQNKQCEYSWRHENINTCKVAVLVGLRGTRAIFYCLAAP